MAAHLRCTFATLAAKVSFRRWRRWGREILHSHPNLLTPRRTRRLPYLQNAPAFITFLTAGYPSIAETVPLLLAMEAGGADIIELGVPFTDPVADGKAIQQANRVSRAVL